MATCKIETRIERDYTLTISQAEANALLSALLCVGGPMEGPRGQVEAVKDALRAQMGDNWTLAELDDAHPLVQNRSAVYFK